MSAVCGTRLGSSLSGPGPVAVPVSSVSSPVGESVLSVLQFFSLTHSLTLSGLLWASGVKVMTGKLRTILFRSSYVLHGTYEPPYPCSFVPSFPFCFHDIFVGGGEDTLT